MGKLYNELSGNSSPEIVSMSRTDTKSSNLIAITVKKYGP